MTTGEPPVPVTGCDHIALAVPDLDAAIALFRDKFGISTGAPKNLPEMAIRIAYADLDGMRLELMEPTGADSPVAKFLTKHPNGGLHHISLTTSNAAAAFDGASNAGMAPLSPAVLRGHHGRDLFFLSPRQTNGVLIEIEDEGHD